MNMLLSLQAIIQEVVFPLMCYTEEDDEMWQEDPYEFIRVKYGEFLAVWVEWQTPYSNL